MSSAPKTMPAPENVPGLSHDDWWKLIDELRVRLQPMYEEEGGAVAFFRRERDSDQSDS